MLLALAQICSPHCTVGDAIVVVVGLIVVCIIAVVFFLSF